MFRLRSSQPSQSSGPVVVGDLEVFTGERFVPGHGGIKIAIEHFQRYSFARQLTIGKRGLDVGCGSGYGAEVLRGFATYDGVDLSAESLGNATHTFGGADISFHKGDAYSLPFDDASFDVVVCFEMLEHVEQPERVVAEIRRVLTADGIAISSTPDKTNYNADRIEPNEFHVHEMERDEFESLMASEFAYVALYPQTYSPTGLIFGDDSSGTFDELNLPVWAGSGQPEAVYWLAVASGSELPSFRGVVVPSSENRNLGKELVIAVNQLHETERELAAAREALSDADAEVALLRERLARFE